MVVARKLTWDGNSLALREHFYHIKFIDDLLRPIVAVFSSWLLAVEPVGWWQMLTFICDFGVVYTIWIFESLRGGNQYTAARIPAFFGTLAQLRGFGVIGPVYYFLNYITAAPAAVLKNPQMRSINVKVAWTTLPLMALLFYVPHFVSHLHPSYATRLDANWLWQPFPLFVGAVQILVNILNPGGQPRANRTGTVGLGIMQLTLIPLILVAIGAWLYVLLNSPFSPLEIFTPVVDASGSHWSTFMTNFVQWDEVFGAASSHLWLLYAYVDLKRAGILDTSLVTVVLCGVPLFVALGPGATFGIGWLVRERILASQSA
ncbi:hypothetical protein P152DRAFT_404825 [Eremomyces bilateralis CBS 781.70]|uniref:Uncharacterized protein n=1 Tax=Eremomyces bilateralis CBS 781.70 TaxID=1392243 RepID=A0A6G1FSP7_9PEZI|nr:uncharacterized protein P152DRAFT_404825 [Eremomyces bilateralis CBS 781.70]KAF1808738.1 hypothetical protein P152DRAFT_404825 [Eremomyces bilateralis CBS 781.70]